VYEALSGYDDELDDPLENCTEHSAAQSEAIATSEELSTPARAPLPPTHLEREPLNVTIRGPKHDGYIGFHSENDAHFVRCF
jgi:hypothetical protein